MRATLSKNLEALLPRGPFLNNILSLLTASSLGYVALLLMTPLLTRLYSPDDFGVLGTFWSVFMILNVIACGGYETVIVLPRDDEDGVNLTILSLLATCLIALVTALSSLLFGQTLADLTNNPDLVPYLGLLAPSVLAAGASNALVGWLTRARRFRLISISRFVQTCGMGLAQLMLSLAGAPEAWGLVGGVMISQILVAGILLGGYFRDPTAASLSGIHLSGLRRVASRYKRFPLLYLPSSLVGNVTNLSIFILISHFFGGAALGCYTLMLKVMSAPGDFISKSITPVFLQRLNEDRSTGKETGPLILSMIKRLTPLASAPALIMGLFGPEIFQLFFGEAWREAGVYAQLLVVFYALAFVLFPISSSIEVFERLYFRAGEQVAHLLLAVLSFACAGYSADLRLGMLMYGVLGSARYLVLIIYILRLNHVTLKLLKQ